jgi:hypothetical protein
MSDVKMGNVVCLEDEYDRHEAFPSTEARLMKRPYVPPVLHELGGRLRRPEVDPAEEPRRLS